ncbi:hypothetical protein BRD00_11635 [Halobacteriales archaeon QS_8_69_26]|nr:MAG: hypothetical protein BRD00_11635 [Halobacteriales archaeon QS_8_69_26]
MDHGPADGPRGRDPRGPGGDHRGTRRRGDLSAPRDRYPLTDPEAWPTGRVAWFDDDALGRWLGVVEYDRA